MTTTEIEQVIYRAVIDTVRDHPQGIDATTVLRQLSSDYPASLVQRAMQIAVQRGALELGARFRLSATRQAAAA